VITAAHTYTLTNAQFRSDDGVTCVGDDNGGVGGFVLDEKTGCLM